MSAKVYAETKQACCIVTLENCTTCSDKNHCFVLREQLAFYNRLGISQIEDDIDADSLASIKYLWQDSTRAKKYDPSWNYAEDNTRAYTHPIHPYPAMMIPQVAGRLIDMYAKPKAVVLDPFCGSGSVLLEAFIRGYDSYGIDINPLSLLISRVKTTPINYKQLQNKLKSILETVSATKKISNPDFFNIDYWFKPQVASKLASLKAAIGLIRDKKIRNFLKVIFSFTVRSSSNTRNGEFKLYRIDDEKLLNFNPDVIDLFKARAEQNIEAMSELWEQFKGNETQVNILNEDARYRTSIKDALVDIVVTSPPYGDSKTTVAYGQFSRLSLQWLGFNGHLLDIDNRSLGGRLDSDNLPMGYSSLNLRYAIDLISRVDKKRARDVMAFYIDLNKCFIELNRVVKKGGFLCMVVGNRTVKGIQLPTDEIVADFGELAGFRHIETIIRKIPNKRMPSKNSPTNKAGELGATMTEEYIVTMEKTR
ncbi:MAG: DNA methyltransferase [Thermodesulfovibrionales bacterium]|nr:DNA methyltransferase [Thermodesulfovibrionales bacterium]